MGFTVCHQEAPLEQDRAVIRCRRLAARLLGQLFVAYDLQQSNDVLNYITSLNYRSAVQRMVAGMITSEWAKVYFHFLSFVLSIFDILVSLRTRSNIQ